MSAIAIAGISERQPTRAAAARAAPFIAPALAVLCAINVLPLLWSIGVSFFHFRADRLNTPPRFLGFGNYADLMTDPDIWEHFVNTGAMIAVSVSIQLLVSPAISGPPACHDVGPRADAALDSRGRDVLQPVL